jgi:hypothetical protein
MWLGRTLADEDRPVHGDRTQPPKVVFVDDVVRTTERRAPSISRRRQFFGSNCSSGITRFIRVDDIVSVNGVVGQATDILGVHTTLASADFWYARTPRSNSRR